MGSELRFYLYLLTWGNLCNFSELVPLICNVAIGANLKAVIIKCYYPYIKDENIAYQKVDVQ